MYHHWGSREWMWRLSLPLGMFPEAEHLAGSRIGQKEKGTSLTAREGFSMPTVELEKGMATPSSILAWRILWTEEPGGLLSMGSHRVRHDWSDLAAACLQKTWWQTSCIDFSLSDMGVYTLYSQSLGVGGPVNPCLGQRSAGQVRKTLRELAASWSLPGGLWEAHALSHSKRRWYGERTLLLKCKNLSWFFL